MDEWKIEEDTTNNEQECVEEFNLWSLYDGGHDDEDGYGTSDDGQYDRTLKRLMSFTLSINRKAWF